MVQKVKLRAREAIGEHEGMLMAEAISENRITLDDMLGALKDAKRQGRPQVIPEGSANSQQLGEMAIKNKEHWDMPFPDLAKALGIAGARSTIECIMHNHHSIFRRKPREKPPLDTVQQADSIRLAEEGLQLPQEAIIFSDEMWVEFNSTRRKKNQSRKRGSNPYLQVDKKDKDNGTIRVMVWAAIAKGFKSRLHIYEPDDILSPEDQHAVIQQGNVILKQRTRRRQEAAHHPGTEEFRILQDTNANIELCNINENRTGRNQKRNRKVEQLFKEHPVPNTITRGGVNWSHQQKTFPSGQNGSVRVDALRQSHQRHPGGGLLRARRQYHASRCTSPSDRSFAVSSSDSARAFSDAPESTCSYGGAFRTLRDLTIRIVKFWSS